MTLHEIKEARLRIVDPTTVSGVSHGTTLYTCHEAFKLLDAAIKVLEASGATEDTIQSGAESCQMKTVDRLERSMTQLTLGDLIKKLEAMPQDTLVANLRKPKSYRGYYEDLAFSQHGGRRLASQFLHDCKSYILNHAFHGYKGGEYTMDALTPLWIAEYGGHGVKLLDVFSDGSIMTR